MIVEVEATYENGVLKLDRPLPLCEQERVRVTVQTLISRARRTSGLLKWTGSVEDLEYLAESPENSPWSGHDL
jgi:predicted DNA-binding antitoxin AbrB/MazE fold protein